MKPVFLTLFSLLFTATLFAQGNSYTVKAENGDGIFSLLRKEGLDPVKYYGQFLELNRDQLKKGSALVIGKEYLIPASDESFKKTAVRIDQTGKTSIFNKELAKITAKSDRLKNAVIYLLMSNNGNNQIESLASLREEIIATLAEKLMVHGAKVYLLPTESANETVDSEEETQGKLTEAPMANLEKMREYIDLVNDEYLKNMGKYQRLLVINLGDVVKRSKNYNVSIYHDENPDGRKFAKNIQQLLVKQNSANATQDNVEVFAQKNNLFLSKNAMPPVTLVNFSNNDSPNKTKNILVRSDKELLTNAITSGIFNDYADLEMQE